MDQFKDNADINTEYVTRRQHVAQIERAIRVNKERYRALYHHLPYANMPKIMIIHGVQDVVNKLNWIPPKGGVSPYLSPYSILTHRRINYYQHCLYTHGKSVQTAEDELIKNDMKPQSLDCIYLNPIYTRTGGHQLLDLNTGRVIEQKKIWAVPLTLSMQRRVKALANKDNITSFKNLFLVS